MGRGPGRRFLPVREGRWGPEFEKWTKPSGVSLVSTFQERRPLGRNGGVGVFGVCVLVGGTVRHVGVGLGFQTGSRQMGER